jgi:hypothetical protein
MSMVMVMGPVGVVEATGAAGVEGLDAISRNCTA